MRLFLTLQSHPRLVSIMGAISGWFSVENIARFKDGAQLVAALLAALVSLCALILTGPVAWAKVRSWWHNFRQPRLPFNLD